MDYRGRQKRLQWLMREQGHAAMLVTHPPNVHYLCGFTGSSAALIVRMGAPSLLLTDGRYAEQAKQEVVGAKVKITDKGAHAGAAEALAALGGQIVCEGDKLSVSEHHSLNRLSGRTLKPVSQTIERLRTVKEPAEIQIIRQAANLASSVFDTVVPDVVPGILESAIAAEIEYLSKRLGAEGMSFETIVASGKRSALPHGRASNSPIPAQGFVVFDFGVMISGYCSDMTRTVHVGRPNRRAQSVYAAVLDAQLAGINAVKAGVETSEVDYAARNVLEKAGLSGYFTHSTGHGVGLEIHEIPGLRKKTKAVGTKKVKPDLLQPGMVITIEPGVYIPGWGGVRIEDMVLVTKTGCEVLTPTAKELVVL